VTVVVVFVVVTVPALAMVLSDAENIIINANAIIGFIGCTYIIAFPVDLAGSH
jgi:hypothetical protein